MNEQHEPKETHEEEPITEKAKGATEKIWDATVKTFHSATFRANQYKRLAQKKIDLASVHKKISAIYSDLGKVIDERREAGDPDVLQSDEVREMLQKLDSLKQAATALEAEKEAIKAEEPPPEVASRQEEQKQDH